MFKVFLFYDLNLYIFLQGFYDDIVNTYMVAPSGQRPGTAKEPIGMLILVVYSVSVNKS